MLALTATADDEVAAAIKRELPVDACVYDPASRPNLEVDDQRNLKNRDDYLANLIASGGKTVIYVNSREQSVAVARALRKRVPQLAPLIGFYNAGLARAERKRIEELFRTDALSVLVATSAFGEGVDIPNIRHVVLYHLPFNEIEFNQMSGRAGRDGAKAYAVLLYNGADSRKLAKRIDDNFPEKEYIRKVYEHLAYFFQVAEGYGENITFEFNIEKFCHTFKHFPLRVNSALKILDRAGYIDYAEEQDNAARVMMTVTRDELYRLTNNTPNEDKVIITLLRSYGGLFSDFRFIDEGMAFVKFDGHVSPCMSLLRNATLYWRQKQRETRSHFFGDLAEQGLDEIWNAPDYADFRRRVRNFEFSPCYRCSLCENWEQGLTDCYGNDAPTCGGCLWSEGVISCP